MGIRSEGFNEDSLRPNGRGANLGAWEFEKPWAWGLGTAEIRRGSITSSWNSANRYGRDVWRKHSALHWEVSGMDSGGANHTAEFRSNIASCITDILQVILRYPKIS